jgi:hypothetical protein
LAQQNWAECDFKSAKAVVVKEDGVILGDHYHRNKEEEFLLLQGKITEAEIGGTFHFNVSAPFKFKVPRLTYHKFICEKGSIILGTATEIFDENDEIKKT